MKKEIVSNEDLMKEQRRPQRTLVNCECECNDKNQLNMVSYASYIMILIETYGNVE